MTTLAADPLPLARMRRVATGLLLLMAAVFVATRLAEPAHPWLGFVRAFAEAAMVGALADWFAVVALFRHPLGLPIPHTAIIPRNKDRIGETLGKFVQENFLAPEVVERNLAASDLAGGLARWGAERANREALAAQLARLVPSLLEALADDDVRRLLRDTIAARAARVPLAPLAADALELLVAQGRHRPLVDELLRQTAYVLREIEPDVRSRIRERTAWMWRIVGVDAAIAAKIVATAEATIHELAADPDHAWRARMDAALDRFIAALRASTELQETIEAFKRHVIEHRGLREYFAALAADLRRDIAADVRRPDSRLRTLAVEIVDSMSAYVLRDDAVRRKLNRLLRAAVTEVVESQRHQAARLIFDTVRTWDADTVSRKIELEVGKDLQYIRINGTLIGGLAGLAIHAVSTWLPG